MPRKHKWETALQTRILAWYSKSARTFYWRENANKAPDPYVVLVSETMLQQTQTGRVQEKLPLFLQRFPTLQVLSKASNAEIITAWEGMGYNSRALRLRDCAKAIVELHSGKIPKTREELLALPGIGPYTASAIAAFAYHSDVAILDVNIRRVYSRLLQPMTTTADTLSDDVLEPFANAIFPIGKSSAWHQSVMDIGALFCTARRPKCDVCPLNELCASSGKMTETVLKKKIEPSFDGVPNRIWRGRVVQLLRKVPPSEYVTFQDISNQLFSASLFTTTEQEQWFITLMQGLERDTIVEIQHTAQRSSQSKAKKVATENRNENTNTSTSLFSDFFVRLAS